MGCWVATTAAADQDERTAVREGIEAWLADADHPLRPFEVARDVVGSPVALRVAILLSHEAAQRAARAAELCAHLSQPAALARLGEASSDESFDSGVGDAFDAADPAA